MNLERVGDYNARQVFRTIRCGGAVTRLAIARLTGLSVPSVVNITNRLIGLGLVIEAGRTSGRGQPARILRARCEAIFGIGIRVDGGDCSVAVIDLAGRMLVTSSIGRDALDLRRITDLLTTSLLQMASFDTGSHTGHVIGIGIVDGEDRPPTDRFARMLQSAARRAVASFTGNATAGRLALHLGSLDEAAIASEAFRIQPKPATFILLTLDEWRDDVFLIDRQPRKRRSDPGGQADVTEYARIHVASVKSLASRFAEWGHDRERRLDCLSGLENTTVDHWFHDCVETLIPLLQAIARLLDPGEVVIGGRMQRGLAQRLATILGEALARDATLPPMTVRPSAYGSDAALVGAAALPFVDQLFPCDATLIKSASAGPEFNRE